MDKTNERRTQNYRIKPLPFATPLLNDESLTSWIVRASIKQGCDTTTFTEYYWPGKRLTIYDIDKGYRHLDPSIHKDISILANTDANRVNQHTLTHFANELKLVSNNAVGVKWSTPLSKRNQYGRIGYPYCPDCMQDDQQAFLKLQWRMSWTVCCSKHEKFLQTNCPHCKLPFQPLLSRIELRNINRCYHCEHKITKVTSCPVSTTILKYHKLVEGVWLNKQGKIFGRSVGCDEWFDYLLFAINLTRIAVKHPNYMFGKLLGEFGIGFSKIKRSKTSLRFDYLSTDERVLLLEVAYQIIQISIAQWMQACRELRVTQNSFNWSKRTRIPSVFLPIYDQLEFSPKRRSTKRTVSSPTPPETVIMEWDRLKRKIEMQQQYERHLEKE